MIVFCDNEGCIVEAKGKPFNLEALNELQNAIATRNVKFSICSGRSTPYIEAISQCLGLVGSEIPSICEGGAVVYFPQTDSLTRVCDPVSETEVTSLLAPNSFRVELGKVVCVSVYPEPGHTVAQLWSKIVIAGRPDWNVTKSIAAVDVTPRGISKKSGVEHVLTKLSLTWSDVLAIGDSWNDLPMLETATCSAAPANAIPEVKAICKYVSPFESTLGVIDILRHFL
jgi:hydroxymethylpyrimidine pyrophosphatase-like HAD family hydrolase